MNFGERLPDADMVSEDKLKSMIAESRWQKGVATIGEHKLECERMRCLDGYIYRRGAQEIVRVDHFMPTEWIHWRDGGREDL